MDKEISVHFLSKQLIDNFTALYVGLLLAGTCWGFAVCLSVDNMSPNLDILLTTALVAGFRPLGTFSLLDPHVLIEKTLRSLDLQPGRWRQKPFATKGGRAATLSVTTTFPSSFPIWGKKWFYLHTRKSFHLIEQWNLNCLPNWLLNFKLIIPLSLLHFLLKIQCKLFQAYVHWKMLKLSIRAREWNISTRQLKCRWPKYMGMV